MSEDRHADVDAVIDHAARQLAREAKDAVSDHPDVEDLIAYQEERLAEDRRERVRQHLVDCPQCAREVLELEDFHLEEAAEPAFEPSAAETTEDWAAFSRRVAEEAPEAEIASPNSASGPGAIRAPMPPPAPPGPGWWAVAAAMVLAAGLGYWIAGLNSSGSGAPTAVAGHLFELDLLPDGEALIRDSETAMAVPASADILLLRLYLGDQTPRDAYRAEILNARSALVWRRADVRRQPAGHFLLMVERRDLPPGPYRLEVTGITGGEPIPVATYTFELRDAGDP